MKNGFFQIGCTPTGTILKLFKAVDGGESVTAKEITEYLGSHQVLYSASTVGQGVAALEASAKEEQLVLLNKDLISEISMSYVLKATSDKMKLTARFYPPSMRGGYITADEFIHDLEVKGVKYGIDEKAIRTFFMKPDYCTDIVVASGKEVKQGTSAWIEYYFQTELNARPELNEDGSVNFFNLNTYTRCKQGDILARLHPEVKGEPGMTVFGEPIKPAEVKRRILKYGRNITASEDGMVITSDVDGHVSLVDGKVFVSNVMELDNVGPATGNIDYEGSVVVLGNILENFSVKAGGNVDVKGVVEGAFVEAGGDIIIARGMKGMGKGQIKAGQNIIAKFIENASVEAKGYVETESILHSTVLAGTDVSVMGKHGFITGGRVCAKNLVRVKTLGSDMGADTIIEVGADPNAKLRIQQLEKKMTDCKKKIAQNKPILENFAAKMKKGVPPSLDQKMYIQTVMTEDKEAKENLAAYQEEYDELEDDLSASVASVVEVSGDVYAGTKICISDVSMVVKNTMTYCKFKKMDGDVKMTSL